MAMVLVGLSTTTALAVDGRVDVRGTRQGGRAGVLTYTTENLWESYSLDQHLKLARSTLFQVRYAFQRDNLWGRSGGIYSESRKETQVPFMSLTYRSRWVRLGLTGNGLRKDTFVPALLTRRDENLTYSIWARGEINRAKLNARYQDTRTWRTQGADNSQTRNSVLSLDARYTLTDNDRLRYSMSNSKNRGITLGTETRYLNNILEYGGNRRFDQNRGKFNILARTSRFDQTTVYRTKTASKLISPVWGGLGLDDTPEELDPLEPDPVQEPSLHDSDLETPTDINIGDSAPVVREFGGDYRNIILDFGDLAAMDSIALYIDTQLNFPGLIQWLVYVSDDPEGREWGQTLTPAQVTINYREWELGRQGWEVQFASPRNHRRVKLVNIKLGVTEPDIFITEMEVYTTSQLNKNEIKSTLTRYRLDGDVSYKVRPDLELNYTTNIYEHRSDGGDRDLSGSIHQAGAIWFADDWNLSGHYQISSLEGTSRFKTNANSQFLSLARRFNEKIDSRISWKRKEDNSTVLEYTTQDITMDVNWRIAPDLFFNQKIGRGMRSDHRSSDDAGSWVLISTIRSYPIKTLSLDLKRMDRWVSEAAGSGFTTFNNTELITRWSIMPLLTYYNQVVYQVRDQSDWKVRNQISWSPAPGGTLGVIFNVTDFRDTRIDIKQKSIGGSLNWRARSNARLEMGAEYVDIAQRGEKNTPHNLYFRGSLNF
jgi:hypothetical protein